MTLDCTRLDRMLPELLDGKRDADAEVHLAACTDCRVRFRDLAATAATVADLTDAYRPPADADAALQRALYARLGRRRATGVNPGWLAVAALAGAAVAALLVRMPSTSPFPSAEIEQAVPPDEERPPEKAGPRVTHEPARPAASAPEQARASKRRRFREAVQADRRARSKAHAATPIEPVLDVYATAPEDADEALAMDTALGGYFAQELRPRLLRGYLDRAEDAIRRNRWLEGCETARLARRLEHESEPARALLLRCEAEADRIAARAEEIADEPLRRTMLRGALLVATPGSTVHGTIERALSLDATAGETRRAPGPPTPGTR